MVNIELIKSEFPKLTKREQLAFLLTASGPWLAKGQIDKPFSSLEELLQVREEATKIRDKMKAQIGKSKYTPKKKKRRG